MFPIIELFGLQLGSYTLLATVGVLCAGAYACGAAKAKGYDDNDMIVLLLISGVGALVGGHLLYGLISLRSLLLLPSWPEGTGLLQIFGGSVFYGGLLGGMAAGAVYAARKGLPLADFGDMAAPAVPLFHMFGRIGCFLGGCCYGAPCLWGFMFTGSPAPGANGVRRFPVQLAEALMNLLLFLLLARLLRRGAVRGGLFALYLLLYASGRFTLEFWRGDIHRGFWLGLSTSQMISAGVFVYSAAFLTARGVRLNRRVRRE